MKLVKKILYSLYVKYGYSQNWNIGFTHDSIESMMNNKGLEKIQWMKHKYRDRFFADPFILEVSNDLIVILAEELIFKESKGRIVKLTIEEKSKKLISRKIVLELDSHLSYPFIYRSENDIYICPENSKSGLLNIYEYDESSSSAVFIKTLVSKPLVDATIHCTENELYLFATKQPNSQDSLLLFKANTKDLISCKFSNIAKEPIVVGKDKSRPAGNLIFFKDNIYRPAQDCSKIYGGGIVINMIESIRNDSYYEKKCFHIYPKSYRYNLGIHTINFKDNICVVDGYGYLHPFIGRVFNFAKIIVRKFFVKR